MKHLRYEYRVRYKRATGHEQVRIFQRAYFAHRLIDRLEQPQDEWSPIVWVKVERREVGPWSQLDREATR
jgi:hypothetical protein